MYIFHLYKTIYVHFAHKKNSYNVFQQQYNEI